MSTCSFLTFHCYSTLRLSTSLQKGDKVLLPPSAFDTLARLQVDYPMLFMLTSTNGRKTHSGVLEFTAEEGCVYIPFWMMQNLQIEEGALVTVSNISLPKATFCKLQPQSVDFLEISNPRAVLEHALRNFSCITQGDIIQIPYNDKNYRLQLCKVEPGPAACIIETDCNVDFEAPVGYVEPVYTPGGGVAAANSETASSAAASFGDTASELSADAESAAADSNKVRIVNGQIVRPEDADTNMNSSLHAGSSNASNELLAPATGQTGVQRNAAIPELAPAVDYWAVAAGDGARLDGKAAPALKDESGQELNVRELRAAAAAKRAAAMATDMATSGTGQTLNGKVPADTALEAGAAAGVPPVQKRKSRVGSKYSKLKPSTAAFRGSANSMDTST
jgi:ubiquitin fusion degradation protein 1